MSKPARLVMDLEVDETIISFQKVPEHVIAAALALYESGTSEVAPESAEIWKLATKFMISGPATLETPKGVTTGIFCGFLIARPLDGKNHKKFKEMVRRAAAVQKTAEQEEP